MSMNDEHYQKVEKEMHGETMEEAKARGGLLGDGKSPNQITHKLESIFGLATFLKEDLDTISFRTVMQAATPNELLKLVLSYTDDGVNKDNAQLLELIPHCLKLQNDKEATYGSSWCKRGEQEIFFNISRKFDRIEKMLLGSSHDKVGEPMIETVADLAIYGLLWVTFIKAHRPDEYQAWVDKIYGNSNKKE